MNRIDRLTAILIQLQTKRIVKAQEIADRFQISLRTVYRDIRALEEGGIPIGAETGLGYYLVDGFHLPPMMLNKDEASALLLSQKLVEQFTDKSISNHLNSAMYKIRAVLNEADKDYVQNLDQSIKVYNNLSKPIHESEALMNEIQQAISSKRMIHIIYEKLNQEQSERILEPVGMLFYANNWHLIAWCNLRNDYRDFRVDRIQSLKVLADKFFETDRLTLNQYLKKMETDHELLEARINIRKDIVPYIATQKYYHGFISEIIKENHVEMLFLIPEKIVFAKWILMLGNAVEIISPPELKSSMVQLSKELVGHYLMNES